MVGSRAVWISIANSIRIDDICRTDVSLELDKLGAFHRTKQLSSFRAPTLLLDLSLRGAYSCSDATAATVIMQAGKPESSHVVSTCVRGQPWQRDGAFQPEDISHLLPPVFRPLACYGALAPFCDKMHRVTSAHGNDASCKANFCLTLLPLQAQPHSLVVPPEARLLARTPFTLSPKGCPAGPSRLQATCCDV